MTQQNFNIQSSVNNSSVVLAAQPSEMGVREMSSLEIAEITGKQHAHVMRVIRVLLEQGVAESNFGLGSYPDANGQERPMYKLTKKGCLILASGYSAVLREKIIDRWESLETGQAVPMYQVSTTQHPKPLSLKDQLTWVKEVSKIMKLNDASTLGMLQQIAQPLNLPVPNYTPSKGFLASATELIERNGLKGKITAEKLNNMLRDKGYVEKRTRPSKKGTKNFHALTEKGLKWGENQVSPHNQKETQIQYYEDKFPQLLKELGLLQKGE